MSVSCRPDPGAIFASLMLAVLALKLHALRVRTRKAAQTGRNRNVIRTLTNVLLSSEQTARWGPAFRKTTGAVYRSGKIRHALRDAASSCGLWGSATLLLDHGVRYRGAYFFVSSDGHALLAGGW